MTYLETMSILYMVEVSRFQQQIRKGDTSESYVVGKVEMVSSRLAS